MSPPREGNKVYEEKFQRLDVSAKYAAFNELAIPGPPHPLQLISQLPAGDSFVFNPSK